MSTVNDSLKYLWTAYFEDASSIEQPADDRGKNHDEEAEWNPSAFRDVLEYEEVSPLASFKLEDPATGEHYWVSLQDGSWVVNFGGSGSWFSLEDTPLTDRKLIFFRQVQMNVVDGVPQPAKVARYILGYEGKNVEGKKEKKVLYIA